MGLDATCFTIGWICALTPELVAAQQVMDEDLGQPEDLADGDNNTYSLGRVKNHYVVIATLANAEYGLASAATVARDLVRSFPKVRHGLLVGVGGGIPSATHDIRLGDVVVGTSQGDIPEVIQYDLGKIFSHQKFQRVGALSRAPTSIRTAVSFLQARHKSDGFSGDKHLAEILTNKPRLRKEFQRPPNESDRLYNAEALHTTGTRDCDETCGDDNQMIVRLARDDDEDNPAIHYGPVGSANLVIKDAQTRDLLASQHSLLCLEMEAAGLMNHFPCLVVRGICDYADSHKNKRWQGYAAMMAAIYTKQLLLCMIPKKVDQDKTLASYLNKAVAPILEPLRADMDHIVEQMQNGDFHKWMRPPDPSKNYNKARSLRQTGSGLWLFRDDRYESWYQEENALLWLFGKSGCGKTILSSTIIDQLQVEAASKEDHTVIYFYFDFSEPDQKQSLEHAIRSLIVQLLANNTKNTELTQNFLKEYHNGQRQPSVSALCEKFVEMLRAWKATYIVLDALDECPQRIGNRSRREAMQWICSLSKLNIPGCHMIITSRPEPDIADAISTIHTQVYRIDLHSDLVDIDIEAYIKQQLQGLDSVQRRGTALQNEVLSALLQRADGMFRWVALQLDILGDCMTERGIRDTLRTLPLGLNETYMRTLDQLPAEAHRDVVRLLQLLLHSPRPLEITEMIDAIAIEFEPVPCFATDKAYKKANDLLRLCPGFVEIVPMEHSARHFLKSRRRVKTIQLSHFSVEEFLLTLDASNPFSHQLSAPVADVVIAKICMIYLLDQFESSHSKRATSGNLTHYCAKYWSDYAKAADEDSQAQALTLRFYTAEGYPYLQALHLYYLEEYSRDESSRPSPLYCTAYLGQTSTSRDLLTRSIHNYDGQGYYGNPLHAAAAEGHEEILLQLLEAGAEVNEQAGTYTTALIAASAHGRTSCVQLLLQAQADVNIESRYLVGRKETALIAASRQGHEDVVRLLLDANADTNVRRHGDDEDDEDEQTALAAASAEGHETIVRLLLLANADPNVVGGYNGTALIAASLNGHYAIVSLLLQAGGNINTEAGYYTSALIASSTRGHSRIVQTLLEANADVNLQATLQSKFSSRFDNDVIMSIRSHRTSIRCGNALLAASVHGHEAVIKQLLRANVNVNAKWGELGTALQAAAASGRRSIVRQLLSAGASVNARAGHYRTALRAAAANGSEAVVRILLAANAEVNVNGDHGTGVLNAARGSPGIYKMLLVAGARDYEHDRTMNNDAPIYQDLKLSSMGTATDFLSLQKRRVPQRSKLSTVTVTDD